MDESGNNPATRELEPPGLPRWVKVTGAVVALLVLVVIAIMVLGGGKHGPGRHGAEGADQITDTIIALSSGASG